MQQNAILIRKFNSIININNVYNEIILFKDIL